MNWFSISKYRSTLMGLAILWVMYFHIGVQNFTDFGWFFHRIGFYGVDIFLFLSGIGVYFSLKKRPNVLGFYKARAARILPAYFIVAIAAYLLLRLENGSIGNFLIYISGIGYWTRRSRFDWYIPTQILFYLLTPLFLFFYNRLSEQNRTGYTLACMASTPFLCIALYYMNCTYLWGTSVRLAVFLLGIHIGSLVEQKKRLYPGDVIGAVSFFLTGSLLSFFVHKNLRAPAYIMDGLNAYPALMMIPALCLLLAVALEKLSEKSSKTVHIITLPLSILGKYSLEIYLLHQRLQGIILQYFDVDNQLLIACITILLAVVLGKIISLLRKFILSCSKKKETA